jgi:hypothetical protein
MKLPTSHEAAVDSSWDIAGIQHEIFLRAFASLRHDLVSPLSVGRMTISLLKRSVEMDQVDKDVLQRHIGRIDQQMQESVIAIRALHLWDSRENTAGNPMAIIRHGLKLSSSRLSVRQISVEITENLADELPPDVLDNLDEVEYRPFLYCWLGMLCFFEDNLDQPSILKLQRKDSKSLLIDIVPIKAATNLQPVQHPRQINRDLILRLARHYSMDINFNENQVILQWE